MNKKLLKTFLIFGLVCCFAIYSTNILFKYFLFLDREKYLKLAFLFSLLLTDILAILYYSQCHVDLLKANIRISSLLIYHPDISRRARQEVKNQITELHQQLTLKESKKDRKRLGALYDLNDLLR